MVNEKHLISRRPSRKRSARTGEVSVLDVWQISKSGIIYGSADYAEHVDDFQDAESGDGEVEY